MTKIITIQFIEKSISLTVDITNLCTKYISNVDDDSNFTILKLLDVFLPES